MVRTSSKKLFRAAQKMRDLSQRFVVIAEREERLANDVATSTQRHDVEGSVERRVFLGIAEGHGEAAWAAKASALRCKKAASFLYVLGQTREREEVLVLVRKDFFGK